MHLKYFVISVITILSLSSLNYGFAESEEPYMDENLKLAEKTFQAEENRGGGSGMPLFEKENISIPFIGIIAGIGIFGIIFMWKFKISKT